MTSGVIMMLKHGETAGNLKAWRVGGHQHQRQVMVEEGTRRRMTATQTAEANPW